ncbi:hypothetical protein KY389_11430 [Paracoccus bogoriensis]|uniref:hypothetical protein n=1 Tax=Paracoccus bogoriensis TaxID=242065 RepID=UPI001CA55F62|nr:hypothetical protein [Paracoccus bogoriensis]MBW7057296.1 hypothetical protein [Paracoccus bogoriensis]
MTVEKPRPRSRDKLVPVKPWEAKRYKVAVTLAEPPFETPPALVDETAPKTLPIRRPVARQVDPIDQVIAAIREVSREARS